MNTIVCGDLHGRYEVASKVLANKTHNKVFVGDYVDSYDKTKQEQLSTLELILNAVEERDDVIALWGNHELSYIYKEARCSGYNSKMRWYINAGTTPLRVRMHRWLDPYTWVGDTLISHAGLSKLLLNNVTVEEYLKAIDLQHEATVVGVSRGGWQYSAGGLFWCDFFDEMVNPEGLKQVVGHSGRREGVYDGIGILWKDGVVNVDCLGTSEEFLEITKEGCYNVVTLDDSGNITSREEL